MVDATNGILKLTKIDFMFVMVCGRESLLGMYLKAMCLHFAAYTGRHTDVI